MNAIAMNIRHLRQCFQAMGRTEDRPRSGLPRVTTRGQDRYIWHTHLCNHFQTATANAANTHAAHNNPIYTHTVRNRLREGRLSARRPYVGCVLVRRHTCVNRVNWSRTHQNWLRQQWNGVLFFYESRFTIHRGDGRVRVYCRRNQRYVDCCVRDRLGDDLVWASVTHGSRTNLLVIEGKFQRYRDEVLVRHFMSRFQSNAKFTLFQRDIATSHIARDTVNLRRANNILFINDWPANNPDLNPIEHLWDNLDQRVRRRPIPPSNVIQLKQALIQEGKNIPQPEINTLNRSMCHRSQAVLHAESGHTRY